MDFVAKIVWDKNNRWRDIDDNYDDTCLMHAPDSKHVRTRRVGDVQITHYGQSNAHPDRYCMRRWREINMEYKKCHPVLAVSFIELTFVAGVLTIKVDGKRNVREHCQHVWYCQPCQDLIHWSTHVLSCQHWNKRPKICSFTLKWQNWQLCWVKTSFIKSECYASELLLVNQYILDIICKFYYM